eukprot:11710773-Heterocapsa_arctica.AAC.1
MSTSATSFTVSTQCPRSPCRRAHGRSSPDYALPAPSRHRRPARHAACTRSAHRHAGGVDRL